MDRHELYKGVNCNTAHLVWEFKRLRASPSVVRLQDKKTAISNNILLNRDWMLEEEINKPNVLTFSLTLPLSYTEWGVDLYDQVKIIETDDKGNDKRTVFTGFIEAAVEDSSTAGTGIKTLHCTAYDASRILKDLIVTETWHNKTIADIINDVWNRWLMGNTNGFTGINFDNSSLWAKTIEKFSHEDSVIRLLEILVNDNGGLWFARNGYVFLYTKETLKKDHLIKIEDDKLLAHRSPVVIESDGTQYANQVKFKCKDMKGDLTTITDLGVPNDKCQYEIKNEVHTAQSLIIGDVKYALVDHIEKGTKDQPNTTPQFSVHKSGSNTVIDVWPQDGCQPKDATPDSTPDKVSVSDIQYHDLKVDNADKPGPFREQGVNDKQLIKIYAGSYDYPNNGGNPVFTNVDYNYPRGEFYVNKSHFHDIHDPTVAELNAVFDMAFKQDNTRAHFHYEVGKDLAPSVPLHAGTPYTGFDGVESRKDEIVYNATFTLPTADRLNDFNDAYKLEKGVLPMMGTKYILDMSLNKHSEYAQLWTEFLKNAKRDWFFWHEHGLPLVDFQEMMSTLAWAHQLQGDGNLYKPTDLFNKLFANYKSMWKPIEDSALSKAHREAHYYAVRKLLGMIKSGKFPHDKIDEFFNKILDMKSMFADETVVDAYISKIINDINKKGEDVKKEEQKKLVISFAYYKKVNQVIVLDNLDEQARLHTVLDSGWVISRDITNERITVYADAVEYCKQYLAQASITSTEARLEIFKGNAATDLTNTEFLPWAINLSEFGRVISRPGCDDKHMPPDVKMMAPGYYIIPHEPATLLTSFRKISQTASAPASKGGFIQGPIPWKFCMFEYEFIDGFKNIWESYFMRDRHKYVEDDTKEVNVGSIENPNGSSTSISSLFDIVAQDATLDDAPYPASRDGMTVHPELDPELGGYYGG